MVDDRRAARPSLPFWRKPNWMVPIFVAALNAVAVIGVAHVTASNVNPLRSSSGSGSATVTAPDDNVLGGRADRTPDVWDLSAVGHDGEQLSMGCEQASNVTVALRTGSTTVTAVMCPFPAP